MQFGREQGTPYRVVGISGTIGAALAQDSILFQMRAILDAANVAPIHGPLQIDSVYLAFTCIVPFTVPLTAGRQLGLYKATGAIPATGTVLTPVANRSKDAGVDSGVEAAKIAIAGAQTPGAAYARSANPFALVDLTAFGTAGARVEKHWSFLDRDAAPEILEPGDSLVLSNPVAMDAAGTFQFMLEVGYRRRDN